MNIRNKKGQAGSVGVGLTMFLIGIVVLFMSIFITSELGDAANASIEDASNLETTYNSVSLITYSAIKIIGLALIVIGALIVVKATKSM